MDRAGLTFSIVTPILNRCTFIRQAIDNVLSQNYPNFEHIVVDGASTDGTLEIIRSYSHLRRISEPDRGSADALNKGLRLVQGDVFGWLNSDELYMPGLFFRVAREFAKDPDLDMLYGTTQFVAPDGTYLGKSRFKRFNLHRQILGLNEISAPSAMFMRRRALDGVGRAVDERWRDTYDHDLWIRVGKRFRVRGIDECFSKFTLHPGSGVANDPMRATREARLVRAHYGGDKALLDRIFWIPYVDARIRLYLYFKLNRMASRVRH